MVGKGKKKINIIERNLEKEKSVKEKHKIVDMYSEATSVKLINSVCDINACTKYISMFTYIQGISFTLSIIKLEEGLAA